MAYPDEWERGMPRQITTDVKCPHCGLSEHLNITYLPCPYAELVKPLGDWPDVDEEDREQRFTAAHVWMRNHRACFIAAAAEVPPRKTFRELWVEMWVAIWAFVVRLWHVRPRPLVWVVARIRTRREARAEKRRAEENARRQALWAAFHDANAAADRHFDHRDE